MNSIEYRRENQELVSIEGLYFNITEFSINQDVVLPVILNLSDLAYEMSDENARSDDSGLYLKSVFEIDRLVESNFLHLLNRNEIEIYLNSLREDENWPEFNRIFKQSINKFLSHPYTKCLNDLYVINKDDFDINSKVVVEREFRAYGFYLLLIWVCNEQRSFYTCEWSDE